jgi:hypothetical protein
MKKMIQVIQHEKTLALHVHQEQILVEKFSQHQNWMVDRDFQIAQSNCEP